MLHSFLRYCMAMSIAAGAVVSAYANNNPIEGKRFKDQVFAKVAVQKNISYKSSLPAGEKAKSFLMDVYQPENDANKARPLIIWIHGGGFRFGKKTSRGTPIWSKRFAKRGYVCAAINYRLTNRKSMSDRNNLMNACKDAMEDVNSV
ncbi:MAG TPA: alpha/beta hydrolase, partial [Niabella sp.]|nr:alpha/beta hydrolase [Niabella sp.]